MSKQAGIKNSADMVVRTTLSQEKLRPEECIRNSDEPVVMVIPGDLHLTKAGLENHQTALWMVNEVNTLIRPDFVQFIGDNVQNADDQEFLLFRDLCDRLEVPFHALVGDHDVHEDPGATKFLEFVGDTYGASSLRGFCLVQLNTQQHRPLGLSKDQIFWFQREVDAALGRDERVVVLQHNYPFQIWEQFDGPGVDAWREVVQTRRIAAIFTGHTHYGQVANDGRNVAITSRSIGDPEGGPPGYTLAYFQGEDLAITYRTIEDTGPVALITHPRETLLATGPQHIVCQRDYVSVHTWSTEPTISVRGRVDNADWFDLLPLAPNSCNCWWHRLSADELRKGEHSLEVEAVDAAGRKGGQRIGFTVDNTKRYTPVPMVRPVVTETKFC